MKKTSLNEMKGGWFIGDFEPSLLRTKDFEASVKYYKAGDIDPAHHHRISTEFTVVVQGEVTMNGQSYFAGDIITISPGESVAFSAVTDAITSVIKIPCVANDKYLD